MFGIQFDTAGVYLVGTTVEQFHVTSEELISFPEGVIGLLEYGNIYEVIKQFFWYRANKSFEQAFPLWIDNSGPVLCEIRHGEASLLVTYDSLDSSYFGRAIKKLWMGEMMESGRIWIVRTACQALFTGLWRNLRDPKIRAL